ncbi:MAG: hypothetical protein U0T36_07040 [Saprospiraceae bacterium]
MSNILTLREALGDIMSEEMADLNVFLMGEEAVVMRFSHGKSKGMLDEFGLQKSVRYSYH